MKYEEPNMMIVLLNTIDVITLSSENGGSGEEVEGPW